MLVIIDDYNSQGRYKLNLNESQLELLYYLNEQDITDIDNIDIIKEDDFKKIEKEND